MGVVPDPAGLPLEVYASREGGVWHPEHGALETPEGWELLPAGDAFVTRRVKAAGLYWSLWQPRDRGHRHRRLVGLLAPAGAIAQARAAAAATEQQRAGRRAQGAAYRARKEAGYLEELTEAVVAYLDFAPRYVELARDIAGEAARRAEEVGSCRVGRTRTLSLEQRTALAARALIRHRYTDYEDRLAGEVWDDEYLYRAVKPTPNVRWTSTLSNTGNPADPSGLRLVAAEPARGPLGLAHDAGRRSDTPRFHGSWEIGTLMP